MTKLKVCGMREMENIQGLQALKPDFMGLIFYEHSKRYVGQELVLPEISKAKSELVGVFVNATLEYILESIEMYRLSFVQLHGNEPVSVCQALRNHQVKIIKALAVDSELPIAQINQYESYVDYFLFDTKTKGYGGSGKKFDWSILMGYQSSMPYFLSGGIGPEDIVEINNMKLPGLFAIDINSGFEIEPGLKDLDLIGQAIELLNDN